MSKLILLLIFSLGAFISQSQSIQDWQKKHPDILLINEVDATENYIQILDKKGIQYIVYSGDININAIEVATSSTAKSSIYSLNDPKADDIKNWIALHSDVKILTQSTFQSLDSLTKQFYLEINALIMSGELLTMEDIRNYQLPNETSVSH